MTLKPLAALIALLALGGTACVSRHKQPLFDAQGYRNKLYHYQVRNLGVGALMSNDWLLDNYFADRRLVGRIKPKPGADYRVTFHLDTNGDGLPDKRREEQRYDLRFIHRSNAGVIWLRTLPIATSLAQTEPRVLMQEFVDGMAGTAYTSVGLGKTSVLVEGERLAARMIDAQPNRVGGAEAFEAIVEIANVDQLKLDPNARRKLAKLVIIRTNFQYGDKRGKWPVLMTAGYANFPEDFGKSLPDFDSLLSRIELGGLAQYTPRAHLLPTAPGAPATAPPTGAGAPPAMMPPAVAPPPPPVVPPPPPAPEPDDADAQE
ncbi:MAG: hypothetical protein R3B07_34885 [Polyangiaceae bacterium]